MPACNCISNLKNRREREAGEKSRLTTPNIWLNSASYKVDLSALLGRSIVCHRPEEEYRYWAVVILVETLPIYASSYAPYAGRLVLARTSDMWQPESNFDAQYDFTTSDLSVDHETNDQTFESAERDKRIRVQLSFPNMTDADYRTARDIFNNLGRSGDMLVLPKPSDIKTGSETPGQYDDWTFEPLYCQFAGDFRMKGEQAGRGSFVLDLREIVGGGE